MAAETVTATPPQPVDPKKKDAELPRDLTREVFETIVFVVVLVLMLKLFVAEAFVIPTGSMASSLWGDQVRCTCRECGHKFPINATITLADHNRRTEHLSSYTCENCGYQCSERDVENDFSKVFPWGSDRVFSGDRVLVAKYAYHLRDPQRFDVPVFKYPVEPYAPKEMQGMNYIKRLVGTGGETIAVFAGDLYTTRDLRYGHISNDAPTEDMLWQYPISYRPRTPDDAWRFPFMYPNDADAVTKFKNKEGGFDIVRKTPDQILAMRRMVFDLDHQPKSLSGVRRTRWHPSSNEGTGWEMEATGFRHVGGEPGWVRYQHIDPWNKNEVKPHWIVDHLGYNARDNVYNNPFPGGDDPRHAYSLVEHWVSDLILDCTVEIPSGDSEVILELNKGNVACQAVFTKGECKLVRHVSDGKDTQRIEMGSQSTKMKEGGKYKLRFANVDSRLTVWVDKKALAFSPEQCDYPPPPPDQPYLPTDTDKLQPARIGARGDVKCSSVSLWRDLHYNCAWSGGFPLDRHPLEPEKYPACDHVQTYYVQPDHYLMFGDNTNSSKDGRSWGLVPRRLMLGRAVVVYWPLSRLGVIE